MTVPNALTFLRIAAIPVVIALLYLGEGEGEDAAALRWWAFGLFLAMAVSDWFDGYLARALNQESNLGRMIDPIADKLVIAALLVALVARGEIAGWSIAAPILIVCRELFVSGMREFLAGRGTLLPVTRLAKWKTTVQLVAVALLLVPPLGVAGVDVVSSAMLWIATLLTLYTGLDYLRSAAGVLAPPAGGD